jgi:hypothetical protein
MAGATVLERRNKHALGLQPARRNVTRVESKRITGYLSHSIGVSAVAMNMAHLLALNFADGVTRFVPCHEGIPWRRRTEPASTFRTAGAVSVRAAGVGLLRASAIAAPVWSRRCAKQKLPGRLGSPVRCGHGRTASLTSQRALMPARLRQAG